jgi:hypothetical protein
MAFTWLTMNDPDILIDGVLELERWLEDSPAKA